MELKLRNLKELLRDDTKIGTEGFKQVTKAIKDTEAAIDKANGKLEETKSQGTGLIGTFKNLAVTLGVAFGVQQIISFAKEAVNLAAKAEGVERAFQRIGSTSILEELRAATRGTVTDLVLMQNAVKASNFKIPLEQLGSLFAFAQARARETGESVDYLVDSIILGIGRKSPMILDNLGISAVALKEKMGGVASETASVGDIAEAVGKIAQENLEAMGVQADTTADRLAQLSTVFDNLLTKGGESLVKLGTGFAYLLDLLPDVDAKAIALTKSLESFKDMRIQDLASGYRSIDEIVGEMLKKQFDSNKLQERRIELEERLVEISTGSRASAVIQEQKDIRERLVAIDEMIKRYGGEAKALSEIIELEQKRAEAANANDSSIKNVYYYTEAIKALNDELKLETTTRERIAEIIKEIPPLQEELARLLGEETKAMKKAREELEKLTKAEEDRLAALDKASDAKLKKRLDIDEFIAARTAMGLKEEMDAAILAEQQKAMLMEADALNVGLSQDKIEAIRQASIDEQLRIQNEYGTKIQEIEDAGVKAVQDAEDEKERIRKAAMEEEIAIAEEMAAYSIQLSNLISQAQQQATQAELAQLQDALDAGQITREEYDRERRELLNEQARQDKELNLFEATVSAFLATIKAYADGGPIAAAIAAAFGIAQVALIASQPVPQFAEGGWVDARGKIHGRKHAHGGVKIEAEGDEFIVKGAMANRHHDIIEAVNNGTIRKLIQDTYVRPAVDAAMLSGFADIGRSADLNGLTAKLSDHNIIAAMDRNRSATVYGLKMLADKMDKRQPKRGGYA